MARSTVQIITQYANKHLKTSESDEMVPPPRACAEDICTNPCRIKFAMRLAHASRVLSMCLQPNRICLSNGTKLTLSLKLAAKHAIQKMGRIKQLSVAIAETNRGHRGTSETKISIKDTARLKGDVICRKR